MRMLIRRVECSSGSGINQGDVVSDGLRIYGDGVNVAARLEALARPGGISIAGKVFDEIKGKNLHSSVRRIWARNNLRISPFLFVPIVLVSGYSPRPRPYIQRMIFLLLNALILNSARCRYTSSVRISVSSSQRADRAPYTGQPMDRLVLPGRDSVEPQFVIPLPR